MRLLAPTIQASRLNRRAGQRAGFWPNGAFGSELSGGGGSAAEGYLTINGASGNQTVDEEQSVVLTVVFTTEPLGASWTYQWYFGDQSSELSGETSATLTFTTDSDSAGVYYLKATNAGTDYWFSTTLSLFAVPFTNVKAWSAANQWIYDLTTAFSDPGASGAIRLFNAPGWTGGFYTRSNFVSNYNTFTDGNRNMIQLSSAPATGGTTGGRARVLLGSPTGTTALMVFDGNSLTAGINNGASYPQQAMLMGGFDSTWNWKNFGVGGQTTAQMSSDAVTQIDSLFNATTYPDGQILVAWEITNDLFFGASQATAYANFVAYCNARRAVGWKVVILDVLPRQDTGVPGTFETNRLAINALLEANWQSYADAFIKISDVTELQDPTNTTYFATDKVHLVPAGNRKVADQIWGAVAGLL